MRMDEKFMPDPALLLEAVMRTDKRLKFGVDKNLPMLTIAQRNLKPVQALETGIYVMTRLKYQLEKVKKEAEEVSSQV